jgi:hypothetical protein
MKMISSATDSSENAVCSRTVPASSALHRALTIGPMEGMVAPASRLETTTTASGARTSASTISAAVAAANTITCGRSTRRCPWNCGAPAAYPTDPAAATTPASPYRPVSAAISSTVPRPNIDIGIRATKPALEKPSAPGRRSTST